MSISANNGFFLIFQEDNRSLSLMEHIDRYSPFTEAISSADFKPKSREIFVLSLDGKNIHTICIGLRKKRVVTLKYAVEFSNFIKLSPPIPIEKVRQNLDKNIQAHFTKSTSGEGNKVPPETWKKLIGYIQTERPELANKIDELFEGLHLKDYSGNDKQVQIFKRDATRVALNFAEIDLGKAESSFHIKNGAELPPFLKGLENSALREDRMLIHDSKIFSDWESLPVTPDITAQYRQGDKILTVQNFNREKVEEQLGVDLLYYNHFYRSFVLIQYKRLVAENGTKLFRLSDRNYQKEYKRMSDLQNYLDSLPPSKPSKSELKDYRFHRGLCYFKLCEATALNYNVSDMIKGMYIPLDYWDELIKSDSTLGRNGGKLISYENVERYFNNTEFTQFIKNGWIGSDFIQSSELQKIISEILESGRSLVLAEFVKEQSE